MQTEINRMLEMYEKMILIRKYEEKIYYLFLEGIMPGSIHQSHGQEACAVGMLFDTSPSDYMLSTHRPAGHDLAKGVSLRSMICEMFGKKEGCCQGKGGAMHTGDITVGAFPANAIVGGNLPIAVGVGLSCKIRKTKDVVICFFGDGASNEGAFHEAVNGASIWNLPVIFVCENNLYSANTSISLTTKIADVAAGRADGYGIEGVVADGNDVLEVNRVANKAIDKARSGGGPTIIELKTYRIGGHSRNDACGYRENEEEKEWFDKDPIQQLKEKIVKIDHTLVSDLDEIEEKISFQIEKEVEYAQKAEEPHPVEAYEHVYWKA